MKEHSLKLRLMVLAVAWVLASLVASAFILNVLFVSNLERGAREDLDGAMTRLIALVDLSDGTPMIAGAMPDPRYDTPFGGRYWQVQVPSADIALRSRSLWDITLDASGPADTIYYRESDVGAFVLLSRSITIGTTQLRLTVGEDRAPMREAAMVFAWDVFRLFLLLGTVIVGAAWLQLWLGLSPFNRLRQTVDEVRRGRQFRLSGRFPNEVMPLVDEVNALLDERETNTERARQRASDLAHGLKTPLAAIQGVSLRIRNKGNSTDADLIDDLAFEMSRRVDYQMRLATLRLRMGEHREATFINMVVLRTVAVIKKTGYGEALHWVVELAADCQVDLHRQDLMELIGIMLENASKWAESSVVVRTTQRSGTVLVEISDDGPGISPEMLSQLGNRGRRLDEGVPGTGLGLAIASEILDLNNGKVEYGRADLGGLAIALHLPLSNR